MARRADMPRSDRLLRCAAGAQQERRCHASFVSANVQGVDDLLLPPWAADGRYPVDLPDATRAEEVRAWTKSMTGRSSTLRTRRTDHRWSRPRHPLTCAVIAVVVGWRASPPPITPVAPAVWPNPTYSDITLAQSTGFPSYPLCIKCSKPVPADLGQRCDQGKRESARTSGTPNAQTGVTTAPGWACVSDLILGASEPLSVMPSGLTRLGSLAPDSRA